MSGNEKKEFGDYQTPLEFCLRVCEYLKDNVITHNPKAVLEPTCGVGNFLSAVSVVFGGINAFGIDINEQYVKEAKRAVPNAAISVGNIFDLDIQQLCKEDNILIIGNPPWATNSNLSYNLPPKCNFKGLRGIDALTGASNFDICEYIILQLLGKYKGTDSVICMLCKTSVARNIILEISRNQVACQKIELLNFNSGKVFGISAAACVLVIRLSSYAVGECKTTCEVKDFETGELLDTLIISGDMLRSSCVNADLDGKCQLTWRQGVKHDCGRVMELELKDDHFVNKAQEDVRLEETLVFPLVKSSCLKKPIIHEFTKYVLVTQTRPKQDTLYIRDELPLTWKYLIDHADSFSGRKSIIYKKAAPFAMFGIGEYSFAPYKVGLSGFYKKPRFCLIYSDKPVMLDDTAYFLPFDNYDMAYCMMLLLNSKTVQEFLLSIAFLDNKRPFTVKLLSRLDLKKCVREVTFTEIERTERELLLDAYVTVELYRRLIEFAESL